MKQLTFAVALLMALFGLSAPSRAQDLSAQYMQAGNTFYSQKNYDMAIRYYQGVVQTNPNSWQAYQGMGNCYYGKGDTANALANYQKALAMNPNNPQLASFVQSLQASAAPAPPAASNPAASNSNASSPVVSAGASKIELDVMAGLNMVLSGAGAYGLPASEISAAGFAGGYGVGFGGGVGAYFPMDKTFSIGGNAAFYAYSTNYTYSYAPFPGESEGETVSNSQSNIEVAAAVKYHFGGSNIQPYLLGGLGFSLVSNSGSVTDVEAAGGVTESSGYALPSTSSFAPMLQAGGGVEFPMGQNMNFFAEAKFNIIFVGNTTYTVNDAGYNFQGTLPGYTFIEFPINVGLNFNI